VQVDQRRAVRDFYRRFAESYDHLAAASLYKKVYDEITWKLTAPYLPPSGLVLDAGGGTGHWAIPMARNGLKVVVYDISSEMLQVAVKKAKKEGLRHAISVAQGDIGDLCFPDRVFDFVLAEGDPISYSADPEKAVSELARVLKPGGYISAGVDNLYSIASSMLNLENEDLDEIRSFLRSRRVFIKDLGFHAWAFSPENLKDLFESYGLRVVKIAGKPVLFQGRPESSYLFKDESKLKMLVELELSLCQDPVLLGSGGHLHVIARRE
jgi:ubiquinone/menaquinone biosynthesis C-methylase UbiE